MTVSNRDPVIEAAQALERGDLVSVERITQGLLARQEHPGALNVLALARTRQNRAEEALALFRRALKAKPGEPRVLFQMGKLLIWMGRSAEAIAVLEDALLWEPNFADAWYELGEARRQRGDFAGAEQAFGERLRLEPGDALTRLALALTFREAGRAADAVAILEQGLAQSRDPTFKAAFAYNLALMQYEKGDKEAALANFTLVSRLDPKRSIADAARADLLAEMQRTDEALVVLEDAIRRDPASETAHAAYNNHLHRLGRDSEFLASYDRAPATTPLQLGKASFLLKIGREEEAQRLYAAVAAREPENLPAILGAAASLSRLGRAGEALTALERARARHPQNLVFHHLLTATALQARDPEKAATLAQEILAAEPLDQYGLALLGSAWRMLGDTRDESLNGYDELIRIFDLEPPEGFSSMAAFNAELNASLDTLHPLSRAPLDQTLRGGSQTRGQLFGAGHVLVEKLKRRIDQAIARHIAETGAEPGHPFRGRTAQGFRVTGSWSSRLADCGFHVNHVHPEGWISSCYYVGVPEAVKDEDQKQGWITFGQPNFDVGLGPRRAVQPVPGRLVLFPSYMWHGTNSFHDKAPRTTIAFDVVPDARGGG